MRLPRTSLAARVGLLALGVVVVTGIVAGLVATNLIRSSGNSAARQTLARLADVSQGIADTPGAAGQARARAALSELNVRSGGITRAGRVVTSAALVRRAVTDADVAALLAGRSISASSTVDGVPVLIEGRPTRTGAVVVVQRRSDAVAQDERAIRRLVAALLIAGGIALAIGLLVAWRLARPLRRTADAAHALAQGRRDVVLEVSGPTEVAAVSSAVNTLTAALAHSEQRQREFLLSVSHDLRTPLTAIAGYAESVADGVVPPADLPRVGAVVLDEARRLERLVGDLLDLSRLDARDLRIEPVDTDLGDLVASAATVWAARCEREGVRFTLERPDGPLVLHTDAARLRQALDGLFDNALRVTPAGEQIVLAARTEGPRAAVEVRDGGPGLTDDDLAVAFEQGVLHERYRGVRRVGTGFGLAIVHRLVARLGGSVEAGHAAEGGASFTVRLPL